jgi:hypothetical protein
MVLETIAGDTQGITLVAQMLRHCFPFKDCTDIYTNVAKTRWIKLLVPLATTKSVALNTTSSPCVLKNEHCANSKKKKKVLMKQFNLMLLNLNP